MHARPTTPPTTTARSPSRATPTSTVVKIDTDLSRAHYEVADDAETTPKRVDVGTTSAPRDDGRGTARRRAR